MLSWATKQIEQISLTLAPPPPPTPLSNAARRFVAACQRGDETEALALVSELALAPASSESSEFSSRVGSASSAYSGDNARSVSSTARSTYPTSREHVPLLHVAAQASMLSVLRSMLAQPGASVEERDAAGNTVLHAACALSSNNSNNHTHDNSKSNALSVVQVLVQEYRASVMEKNHAGETPYDVATLNSVRQFLLPIQLQTETQWALDNGGVGLPPGIDMGGLRPSGRTLAPPPTMGTRPADLGIGIGPPPHSPLSGGEPPTMTSHLVPPTTQLPSEASPMNLPYPCTDATTLVYIPTISTDHSSNDNSNNNRIFASTPSPPSAMSMGPTGRINSAPASMISAAGMLEDVVPTAAPMSGNAKSRNEYALTGHSSAAIFNNSTAVNGVRRTYRPDGFHSSSSDKRLQQKYGHEHVGLHVPKVVPPPPSSGGRKDGPLSSGYISSNSGVSATTPLPASTASYSNNPYAGGARNWTQRRYVAVDPVTGQAVQPPMNASTSSHLHLSSGAAFGSNPAMHSSTPFAPPTAVPSFTVFLPGASNVSTATTTTTSKTALDIQPPPLPLSSSSQSKQSRSLYQGVNTAVATARATTTSLGTVDAVATDTTCPFTTTTNTASSIVPSADSTVSSSSANVTISLFTPPPRLSSCKFALPPHMQQKQQQQSQPPSLHPYGVSAPIALDIPPPPPLQLQQAHKETTHAKSATSNGINAQEQPSMQTMIGSGYSSTVQGLEDEDTNDKNDDDDDDTMDDVPLTPFVVQDDRERLTN